MSYNSTLMNRWVSLSAGSLVGGFSRYFLAGFIHQFFGSGFPYGTMIVNLAGCFLIGLFNCLAEEKFLLSPSLRLLLMTGFCGAFTTFSTFILETFQLMKGGEFLKASANVSMSVVIGFFVFYIGTLLGRWI